MLDPAAARAHFPSLASQGKNRNLVFFDNPAGTQVPREMMDASRDYLEHSNANVGGAFRASEDTDHLIGQARREMATFLNAASPKEIVFGQNMTTLTFHLSHALARTLRPGDSVVLTRLEHDANIAPWLSLEQRGVEIRWIDFDPDTMTLDLSGAERVISPGVKLVAFGYASNAFGTINDVSRLTAMAREAGAWTFIDAVHYAPHGPIDVQELGCDFLVCSPYKFFGPHLGVLYGRYDLLCTLQPDHVRPAGDAPPDSWETGTKSHEALAGLLGALSYLRSLAGDCPQGDQLQASMSAIQSYERSLSERLLTGLGAMSRLRVYGPTQLPPTNRVPTFSFLIDGIDPYGAARQLAERGISSWAGNHYALEPMRRLGLEATQRIGLVHYNTTAEIDLFLNALEGLA